jgi:hypothetical protein
MLVTLSTHESESYFYNALCNGLSYIECHGISIDFNAKEYKTAKMKLTYPCYEDVLMQILRDGGKLTLVDEEGDGDYTSSITIKDVHERVQNTEINHLMNMVNGNDDAITADVILQSVFFNEVIFG